MGQAALSALLSIILAIPVTQALMRQEHGSFAKFGRAIFALPLMIPSISVIFGIIAIFGNNGALSKLASILHLPWFSIYGWTGILIAHVFLNFPVAVRLLLEGYRHLPYETWRLAASLGFSPRQYWRHIDLPLLRQYIPMIAALIFLLCLTSFAIILVLGGGPKYTTLEVAIYQALRFDFNPKLALQLSLLQTAISGLVLLAMSRASLPMAMSIGLRNPLQRWDGQKLFTRIFDYSFLTLSGLFVLGPIMAVLGIGAFYAASLWNETFFQAFRQSVFYAFASGVLSVSVAWFLCSLFYKKPQWRLCLGAISFMPLIVSPVMLGSIILIINIGIIYSLIHLHILIIAIYAFMGLPFALYVLWPAYRKMRLDFDRLVASLVMAKKEVFTRIHFPLLLPAIKRAWLYAALAIFGDFGLVAILGDRRALTLPWYLYDQLGSYRSGPAGAISAFMLVFAFLIIVWADRNKKVDRHDIS